MKIVYTLSPEGYLVQINSTTLSKLNVSGF